MNEGINIYLANRSNRDSDYYYRKSRQLYDKALSVAEDLKGNPKRFVIDNGITMDVEITKSDLRNIIGKYTRDSKFNAIKNALATDLEGYLRKATYEGWRPVRNGKHTEAFYFAYYSRKFGTKSYLCMRKMSNSGVYKPYAIIDEETFSHGLGELRKDKPPK